MKETMKKLIALCLALMLVFSLVSCGSSGNSSTPAEEADASQANEAPEEAEEADAAESTDVPDAEDTANAGESVVRDVVNVGIAGDVGDLSPWAAATTGRTAVEFCIYQGLAHVIDGEIVGILMRDYELAEDESYMDCYLYDYIYDNAGNHMTASDVVFSFDKCMEGGNVMGFGFVDHVEAVEEYTARFYFNTTLYAYDIETLFENFFVVTEAAYNASPDGMVTTPVSTAPYVVTNYTAGYILTCEKAESYWQTDESLITDRDKANVQTINYYILTETTQMSNALKTGDIDMCWTLTGENLDAFEGSDDYWVYQRADNAVVNILCNCSEEHATVDENLRKAIYYAINGDALLQSVFNGDGVLCYDTAAPKAPDYLEAWANEDNYYHFNLDTAKEYLDAWGGDPSSLNLVILSDNTINSNVAQMVQGFLGQIGITSSILTVDAATIITYQNDPSAWDILVVNKATGNFVTTSWKNTFSETYTPWGGSINFIFDDELQRLLNEARLLATHNDETVDAFHQYIVEHAYGYGSVNVTCGYVLPNFCSSIATSYKGSILPGGCVYTE